MMINKKYSDFLNESKEHEDLEERVQISAEISFGSTQKDFNGLKDLEVEIVKKKIKVNIENIELRKPKSNRNSLF